MPPLLLDLLYVPAFLGFLPVLLYQKLVMKKNRGGWAQRFGFVPARGGNRKAIWVHAVSLGEVNATRSLVSELERRLPDHDVFLSATTDTGYAAACKHYDASRVIRYPLDFSFVVNRVLDRVRPAMVILMELEVWPNFIELCHRRGIPVGIANGRVTEEKSMRRFRKPAIRALARSMFRRIDWIGAQDETYAARFVELGAQAEAVKVTGSMKYDTAVVGSSVEGDEELAREMGIDRARPLLVAGSTGPDEEEMVLAAYGELRERVPGLQLAIVPRKPERFDEVARLIESRSYACVRRSKRDTAPSGAVFLGDKMGELRKFYSLASVVFVGRTLVPMGGSDLMEVAALGKPMCFGPYVENFADAAEKLGRADAAVQISSVVEFATAIQRMLADPAAADAMGRRAQAVVQQNVGATGRTVDLVCACLTKASPQPHP